MKAYDLIIVGAGPAGMSAAIQASALGIKPLVIDENDMPGGRIYAQSALKIHTSGAEGERKKKLLKLFVDCAKIYCQQAQVIGIFPGKTLLITGKNGTSKLKFKSLIIATGAYELSIPFPGWTLPGVMTSGCVQTMIKTQGIIPQKAVVAGTGPLQLVLAGQIIKNGGKVSALVETGSFLSWLKTGPGLLYDIPIAKQVVASLFTLFKDRVPIFFKSLVSSAKGNLSLKSVTITSLEGKLRKKLAIPVLCVGYGFVSSHEISLAAGASQVYRNSLWGPLRDENMQTTVEGLFAAGDGAQINGALMAEYEGAVAAISAAQLLGVVSKSEADKKRGVFLSSIHKEKKLRRQISRIMSVPEVVYDLACDDTVICRCEDIKLRELKAAVEVAGADINEIKRWSRVGMGPCQGRTCGSAAIKIASKLIGTSPEKLGTLSPRPPFKPVTLGQLTIKNGGKHAHY